ncbi:MAG: hypothetical protein IJQ93_14250, partial [Bacteroidales bacterium]|nr:hypothetical protein [Bacteroidales bacterium]
MKKFALLLAILIIAGCGGAKKKEQKVSGTVEELVPVKDSLINPAGGLFDTDYKYIFFGKIGY